ncbi:tyrosine-type recombinase/integrase [Lentisalinibacter sediminis]|uniref:tyrosine-type recombinase/integrase n=1 Tax=Lentisalinibacter sediminis TaxID=2992237 RepID=UPI00386517D0
MSKLTDIKVTRTKPGKNDKWLADGNGLYLRITPAGARSWWYRKTSKGQRIQDRIGSLDEYGLKEARAEAAKLATKSTGRGTVEDLAERWYKDCIKGVYRRPHHVRGYMDRAIIPDLGDKPLRRVSRSDVVDMLTAYKKRGTVAANNLRRIAAQMFGYGVELGWLDTSPADGITERVCGPSAQDRERVLTDDEIRHIWNHDGPHQKLIRLLLLTGLRIGEARMATWADVEDDQLHIPPEHSKNGRAHWVHLPPLALGVIGDRGKDNEPLVSDTSPTAAQAWLKRHCVKYKIDPAFTPHDLRRTYATRLNELGIAPHVVERCLNHVLQGVMKVYNRAEYETERKDAAETWAAEIERLLGVVRPQNVVRMEANR